MVQLAPIVFFYVLLIAHLCIILKIKPNWFAVFLSIFIFINGYMFRATMGPSSGDTTVFMRHIVHVILRG